MGPEEDLIVPEGLLFQITGPVHLQLRNGSHRFPGLHWIGQARPPAGDHFHRWFAGPLLLFPSGCGLRIHDVSSWTVTHHASVRASNVRGVVSLGTVKGKVGTGTGRFRGGTDQYVARFANTSMLDCAFGGAKDDAVTIIGGEADLGTSRSPAHWALP